jgi:hypothetical protein
MPPVSHHDLDQYRRDLSAQIIADSNSKQLPRCSPLLGPAAEQRVRAHARQPVGHAVGRPGQQLRRHAPCVSGRPAARPLIRDDRAAKAFRHRCLQQELAYLLRLAVQHFSGQIVEDVAVTAAEGRHEPGDVGSSPQRPGAQSLLAKSWPQLRRTERPRNDSRPGRPNVIDLVAQDAARSSALGGTGQSKPGGS